MIAGPSRSTPGDVTLLLGRLQRRDRTTPAALMERVYPELRKLARGQLRHERPDHLLQPTALVHEAYVRLVNHRHHHWRNRAHFCGAAARLMRRILVDYARAGQALKRGGDRAQVALDGAEIATDAPSIDMLALDQALTDLERVSPRQARVVKRRYFGGLTVAEAAEALGTHPRMVDRDWSAARVWLRRRLRA